MADTDLVVTEQERNVDQDKVREFFDVDPDVVLAKVVLYGDVSKLTPREKVNYYNALCHAYGLNPAAKPFDYLTLKGKDVLYANRNASDQLRRIRGVSVYKLEQGRDSDDEDLYFCIAYGEDKTGRKDVGTGYVNIAGLKGEALGNAKMKCETKAKRRMTLSICGLGMMDESEIESIEPQYVEHPTPDVLQEYREKIYKALEDNVTYLSEGIQRESEDNMEVAKTVGDFRTILDTIEKDASSNRQREARADTKEKWKNIGEPIGELAKEAVDAELDEADEQNAELDIF